MTFLELKAKICYLQPQRKVIINNVWRNLTGTWKEEWKKKKTISLSRAVNVPRMEILIWEMPGPIQLSVLISRWKGYFLSHNTSRAGSVMALLYGDGMPMTERAVFIQRPGKANSQSNPRQQRKARAWLPLLPHLCAYLVFLSLTNLLTATRCSRLNLSS